MTALLEAPAAAGICDLSIGPVNERPFEHVLRESFIHPDAFAGLRDTFPTCPPASGPTGYSLYWGDPGYEKLLNEQPVWRALFETFHSQRFVDWGMQQFAGVWERERCLIDVAKARYVPYQEDRIDKDLPFLRKVEHEPHELWVRMDIYQGRVGYSRAIHRDWKRRMISMLIYFCDADEHGLVGGQLLMHNNGWNKWSKPAATVTPRENLMAAFPCSGRSYHSVPAIRSLDKPRNYMQIQISSSVDAWDHSRF